MLCCVSPDDVCPDLHSRVGSAVYAPIYICLSLYILHLKSCKGTKKIITSYHFLNIFFSYFPFFLPRIKRTGCHRDYQWHLNHWIKRTGLWFTLNPRTIIIQNSPCSRKITQTILNSLDINMVVSKNNGYLCINETAL